MSNAPVGGSWFLPDAEHLLQNMACRASAGLGAHSWDEVVGTSSLIAS